MVGVVILPEKMIEKIKNRIVPEWKACFLAALLVGLLAHLYKITNWLPNWDSLVFRYDAQNMIEIGRWFLPVVCSFSSFYDLPFLNGLLAILLHALGAVCICKIFDVKKSITAALIGAIVISFPTVTSVLMYNYVADGYAFSFLLSGLAAMYLTREKPRYIVSIILLTLSVGIYQAYMSVSFTLVLLHLIDELIFKKKEALYLFLKSLKILISCIIAVALYYLIMMLVVKVSKTELIEYQGFGSAVSLSGLRLADSLYVIWHSFFDYFFDFTKGACVYNVLNCIVFFVAAIGYFISAVKNKAFLPFYKGLLLIIYVILLPVASVALAIINPAVDYHNLMKMGYCVFYILFIILYDKTDKEKKLANVKSWVICITAFMLIANQVVIANVSYHKGQMAYEKSFGTLVRIADRIEQTEGAEDCGKILVIGALENSEAYSDNLPPDMTGITEGYILRADDETVKQSVLCSALNDYCEKEYKFVSGEAKKALMKKEEISKMATWPKKDSVKVVDNIIVIKLGTESE